MILASLKITNAAELNQRNAMRAAKRLSKRRISGIIVEAPARFDLRISPRAKDRMKDVGEWLNDQVRSLLRDRSQYDMTYKAFLHG